MSRIDKKDMLILQKMMIGNKGKLNQSVQLAKNRNVSRNEYSDDFANFYSATQDIYDTAGSGDLSGQKNLLELQFLSEARLGTGYAITHGYAKNAMFNWFKAKKEDSDSNYQIIPGLNKFIKITDFKNQTILWDAHRRIYGVGLLLKFWKANEDMSTPAPKRPPRKFQVIPPTVLAPVNTWETRMLDYDQDMWEFMGGNLKVKQIHPSRIAVIRGEHRSTDWRGISVLERNYLALICYYNGLIYLTKGLAKWGSVAPVLKTGKVTPTIKQYDKYLELMTAFIANNFFIVGANDEVIYPTTNVAAGLSEALEMMKEEISAGTQIPLNTLFGRSVSGGIGGEGAMTSERIWLNGLANEQTEISDDLIKEFEAAGFDFEGLDLGWNLALQKTTEQQLAEDSMRLQNEMMEQQLKMQKQENKMMTAQQELFDKHKDQFTAEQQLESAETIKEDFDYSKKRFTDFKKLQQMISLRGKA